jgi:hypothetical protein
MCHYLFHLLVLAVIVAASFIFIVNVIVEIIDVIDVIIIEATEKPYL